MEAVKENKDYLLHYTREATGEVIEKTDERQRAVPQGSRRQTGTTRSRELCSGTASTGWNLLSNTEDFCLRRRQSLR